jgi:hypothetical protein
VLTFSGSNTEFSSLKDSKYTLTVQSSQVTDNAGNTFSGGNTFNFHRLFGDANGDAVVNAADLFQFRLAFGSSNSTFDFDGVNGVNAADLFQFRLRFGTGV